MIQEEQEELCVSKLEMNCYFCNCALSDVNHFSVDENSNVIVACDKCYQKVKVFNRGGKKNVKSGLRNKGLE